MPDANSKSSRYQLVRSRAFLVAFFGLAGLLIGSTVINTLANMDAQKVMEEQEHAAGLRPPDAK